MPVVSQFPVHPEAGHTASRLRNSQRLRQERPCRGLLLSTSATTIEGKASALSRMLVLEIAPWEQRKPSDGVRGHRVRVWRLKADLFGDSTDDSNLAANVRL